MKEGCLIVIEGLDGSGKATQQKLLANNLTDRGYKVKQIDFPRYYNNFMGKFIGECLAGHYGNWVAINPRIASVIYAVDRYESSDQIRKWLDAGYIVIADRYATSNQLYQGGKIDDPKELEEFMNWLDKLEYEVLDIPRPDMVIYLDMPVNVSKKLVKKHDQDKKAYTKDTASKEDLHERNEELQRRARKTANLLASKNNWIHINCIEDNKLLPPDVISKEILKQVTQWVKQSTE